MNMYAFTLLDSNWKSSDIYLLTPSPTSVPVLISSHCFPSVPHEVRRHFITEMGLYSLHLILPRFAVHPPLCCQIRKFVFINGLHPV